MITSKTFFLTLNGQIAQKGDCQLFRLFQHVFVDWVVEFFRFRFASELIDNFLARSGQHVEFVPVTSNSVNTNATNSTLQYSLSSSSDSQSLSRFSKSLLNSSARSSPRFSASLKIGTRRACLSASRSPAQEERSDDE